MISPRRRLRTRRGSALILVLLMTLAVAALAVAAIFMTSSAGLLSRFYDKERLYGLAAESGLELAVARLRSDGDFAIADTGMTVVLSGISVRDADGNAIPGANVFVYAMVTGDTTGSGSRTLTFIARAYDNFGTRHVRRMDVRQESLTRYTLLVDSFPSTEDIGPLAMRGRVHSNSRIISENNTVYFDSVTAVGTITGNGVTYAGGSAAGASAVPFPRDSAFAWMATTAATANLSYTATGNGRTRLEFVTVDVNNNGVIEAPESYIRIFVLTADGAQFMEVDPPYSGSGGNIRHDWQDRIVQNQCGAFYLRSGRWHFFPVATHRASWAWTIITNDNAAGDYPDAPADADDFDVEAVERILTLPTARCFPIGSPYLVNTERFTRSNGQISPTQSQNTFPWGSQGGSANRYGGSDTTFTRIIRTCTFNSSGTCNNGTNVMTGVWAGYSGTQDPALPDSLRLTHWPLHVSKNANARGLVNVTGDVYVSGVVRGQVTLRVGGTARLLDQLVYVTDPNDPNQTACTNMLGLVATGDILVANGAMSRVRRFGSNSRRFVRHMGPAERFALNGYLLSTGGTIGVESPSEMIGNSSDAIDCPGPTGNSSASGGCFAHTGSAAMRRYTAPFSGNQRGGLRPFPTPDRCMLTGRRPPFFPGGVGFTVLRTMELEPARANTNARIEVLLRSLRGRNLD
jgi:hypothetical protein